MWNWKNLFPRTGIPDGQSRARVHAHTRERERYWRRAGDCMGDRVSRERLCVCVFEKTCRVRVWERAVHRYIMIKWHFSDLCLYSGMGRNYRATNQESRSEIRGDQSSDVDVAAATITVSQSWNHFWGELSVVSRYQSLDLNALLFVYAAVLSCADNRLHTPSLRKRRSWLSSFGGWWLHLRDSCCEPYSQFP